MELPRFGFLAADSMGFPAPVGDGNHADALALA